MKQLKVFKTFKEKIGSLKLVRKAKVVLLSVSLAASLVACSVPTVPPETTRQTSPQPNTSSASIQYNSSSALNNTETPSVGTIERVLLDDDIQQIVDANVVFSESSNLQMQNLINSIRVSYPDEELYNINAALAKYNAMPSYSIESSVFITAGRIDVSNLRKQILQNNKEFKERWTNQRFIEFSNSDFEKVFNHFVTTLQYRLDQGEIDSNLLDEKLKYCKLLETKDSVTGAVSFEENLLSINLTLLTSWQEKYPDIDYLKKATIHETNHYIQMYSLEEKENRGFSNNAGIAYAWDDLAVNSLYFEWYYEASAEQLMAEEYNIRPIVYPEGIKALETMTLVTILRDNVHPTSLSRVSYQKDLNKLFEIFGADTKEQQQEILKMFFAYDVAEMTNQEFFRVRNEKKGEMSGSEGALYRFSLKSSIAQTLSKHFYSNLSDCVASGEVKVEEVFNIISTFEADLNKLSRYTSSERLAINAPLLENYVLMQDEFLGLLAKDNNLDFEDLQRAYNAYNTQASGNIVQLLFLNKRDNDFYRYVHFSLQEDKTNSINSVNAALNKDNHIK